MDPLSLTATLVGLITAAAQGYNVLASFVDRVKSAPNSTRSVLGEVSDICMCLKQLKEFLVDGGEAPRSRPSSVTVEQIVIVLTNLALLISELQGLIEGSGLDQPMGIIDRVKWLSKEGEISKLLVRLQASKASLTLMVTTLTCTSVDEANRSILYLADLVEQVLKENQSLSLRMKSMESILAEFLGMTCKDHSEDGDRNKHVAAGVSQFGFTFEEELEASRVYGRAATRNKRVSITPSTVSMGWSFVSHVTLSEVSNLSLISLPLSAKELRNGHCYSTNTNNTGDMDLSLLYPWYNPPPYKSAFIRSSPTTANGEIVHRYDRFDSTGETLHAKISKKKQKLLPSVAEEQYWQVFKSQMESTYPKAPSYARDPIFASLNEKDKVKEKLNPIYERLSAMD
ncbi:MAG: hypothetical protein MMC33_003702 [Icmadophila ericetorum]|nr:hypothetical protein [Icmadophila ericetorum]